MEYVATNLLEILERDGYVKTITDENGEKELVKIEILVLQLIQLHLYFFFQFF